VSVCAPAYFLASLRSITRAPWQNTIMSRGYMRAAVSYAAISTAPMRCSEAQRAAARFRALVEEVAILDSLTDDRPYRFKVAMRPIAAPITPVRAMASWVNTFSLSSQNCQRSLRSLRIASRNSLISFLI